MTPSCTGTSTLPWRKPSALVWMVLPLFPVMSEKAMFPPCCVASVASVRLFPVVAQADFSHERHAEFGHRAHETRQISGHDFNLIGGHIENQLVVHLHDQTALQLL